jgi:hypothetical protein
MMIPGASQVFFHSDGVPKTYLSFRIDSELAKFRPRQTPDMSSRVTAGGKDRANSPSYLTVLTNDDRT